MPSNKTGCDIVTDWDQIDDMFTAYQLKVDTAAYMESKNPLFLWRLYQNCRREKIEPPPWVLEYFDQVAVELIALEGKRHIAKDVLFALRLDAIGKNTKTPRTKLTMKTIGAYQKYNIYRSDLGLDKGEAEERLSKEYGNTTRTIRRWIKNIREALDT